MGSRCLSRNAAVGFHWGVFSSEHTSEACGLELCLLWSPSALAGRKDETDGEVQKVLERGRRPTANADRLACVGGPAAVQKTFVIEARASHRVSSSLASGYQNRLEKRCQVSMAVRFYRPFLCCEVTLSENTGTLKASRTSLFVDCGLHGEFVALSLTVLCLLRTKHTSWLTHFG